jgi:transposase InsO family protein
MSSAIARNLRRPRLTVLFARVKTSLECELIDRSTFRNHDEARDATFDFIEGFYNTHRRHSALGYHSPVQEVSKFTHRARL